MSETHHRYYAYGERTNTWGSGTYQQVWFWDSPDKMPISRNFYAAYHRIPNRTLSEEELAHFKANATPISKEEYEKHIRTARKKHSREDYLEYMFGNPFSD